MKIKCISLNSNATDRLIDEDPWLTMGKEYIVLSVFIATGEPVEYRLISDESKTPALFAANQFDVIDGSLPFNWIANTVPGSYLELAPSLWTRKGFWEDYFDGVSIARGHFDCETEKILNEYTQ